MIQKLNASAEKANVALSTLANAVRRAAVVSGNPTRAGLRRRRDALVDTPIGLGGRWV